MYTIVSSHLSHIHLFTVAKSELQATVDSLQVQLQDQEESANNAIDQWQAACVEAEERCTTLETELESLKRSQLLMENADKESELETALQTIAEHEASTRDLKGTQHKWKVSVSVQIVTDYEFSLPKCHLQNKLRCSNLLRERKTKK